MKREEIISLIDEAIATRKGEVLFALNEAGVLLPSNPTDKKYREIIVKEIEKGNAYLTVYLGEVINKMIPKKAIEHKSNWIGAAITTGAGILGSLFGGNDKEAKKAAQAQQAAYAAQQAAYQKQMAIVASQQNAQNIIADVNSQNRREKTKRTVVTLSIVGGALLLGTVAAILIIKKK